MQYKKRQSHFSLFELSLSAIRDQGDLPKDSVTRTSCKDAARYADSIFSLEKQLAFADSRETSLISRDGTSSALFSPRQSYIQGEGWLRTTERDRVTWEWANFESTLNPNRMPSISFISRDSLPVTSQTK